MMETGEITRDAYSHKVYSFNQPTGGLSIKQCKKDTEKVPQVGSRIVITQTSKSKKSKQKTQVVFEGVVEERYPDFIVVKSDRVGKESFRILDFILQRFQVKYT